MHAITLTRHMLDNVLTIGPETSGLAKHALIESDIPNTRFALKPAHALFRPTIRSKGMLKHKVVIKLLLGFTHLNGKLEQDSGLSDFALRWLTVFTANPLPG